MLLLVTPNFKHLSVKRRKHIFLKADFLPHAGCLQAGQRQGTGPWHAHRAPDQEQHMQGRGRRRVRCPHVCPASGGSPRSGPGIGSGTWARAVGAAAGRRSLPPPGQRAGQAPHRLPILFKIVQASRKILKAVDLFVALATVKLKSLICEDAVQLGGKWVSAGGTRGVASGESKDRVAGQGELSGGCRGGLCHPQHHLRDLQHPAQRLGAPSWSGSQKTQAQPRGSL